jgi:hypothetical protein
MAMLIQKQLIDERAADLFTVVVNRLEGNVMTGYSKFSCILILHQTLVLRSFIGAIIQELN